MKPLHPRLGRYHLRRERRSEKAKIGRYAMRWWRLVTRLSPWCRGTMSAAEVRALIRKSWEK